MNKDKSNRVYVGNLAWKVKWQDLKDHMKQMGEVLRVEIFEDRDGRSQGCGVVEFEFANDAKRAISELTDTELMGRKIFVREDREDHFSRRTPMGGSRGGGRGYARGGYGAPAFYGAGGSYYGGPFYDNSPTYYGGGGYDYNLYGDYGGYGIFRRGRRGGYFGGGGGGFIGGGYGGGRPSYSAPRGGPIGLRDDSRGRQLFVGNLSFKTSWQDLKDHFRQCGEVLRADIYAESDGRSKGCGVVLFANEAEAQKAIETLNDTEFEGRMIAVRMDQGHPRRLQ